MSVVVVGATLGSLLGERLRDTWFVVGREVARRTWGPTVLTKKSGF